MKKIATILFLALLTFVSCSKEDDSNGTDTGGNTPPAGLTVEKKNFGLLMDFSEDWCPLCGAYGGPALDSALSQEGLILNAIKISSGSNNDSLNSPISGFWASDFNVINIPTFYVNNSEVAVTTNIASTFDSIIQRVNQFVNDSVIAGIALKKSIISDSVMQVVTKVQFFKADNNATNYSLGVYLIEDNVISDQITSNASGSGSFNNPNYVHRNILRIGNTADYLGSPVNNTTPVAADQTFTKTFNLKIKPYWNPTHLKVIAVLWKNGTGTPKMVNSRLAP